MIEASSLLLLIAILGLAFFGAAFFLYKRDRNPNELAMTALSGRLEQMAISQATLQAALEQRITYLTDRVSEGLQTSTKEAGQSLTDLRERLAQIDVAQANILALSSHVVDLKNVLGNKQARGAFGETQLADILQSTLPAQSFELQAQIDNKRVDCLVKLPNPPGSIAIDAKFPLEAWRAMQEARDETQIAEATRQFAIAIRHHIRAIAEKYIVPGKTADSALMFLPSEAVYMELHSNFPALVDEAGRARVWIVSPTTLMATLITLRSILKDFKMREQASIIRAKVIELSKDVERLDDRVKNLQNHFDQTQKDIREITISTRKICDRILQINALEEDDKNPISTLENKTDQTFSQLN